MTESRQSDIEQRLAAVAGTLHQARWAIVDAREALAETNPSVFVVGRLDDVIHDLILLASFIPGLAPARPEP